jgi:hypothetical protein
MAALKLRTIVLALTAVCALPAIAAAQSATSAFTVSFDRSGVPGTETVAVIDPVTGGPAIDPATGAPKTFTRDTGAVLNPCTNAYVDFRGAINVSMTTTKTSAAAKAAVSATTKASGSAWTSSDNFVTRTPSGTTYAVTDSQQFSMTGRAGQLQRSDFTDRLTMRGPGAGDYWMIRVTSTLAIDALGRATVTIKEIEPDSLCRG